MSCVQCNNVAHHICGGCNVTLYCSQKCQMAHYDTHMKICGRVETIRPDLAVSQVSQQAYTAAYDLLLLLKEFQANVITSESLTAGKLAATLVDIPTFGAYIYGGLIVYDSDAKRKLLGTTSTRDVYTAEMAEEMATNALLRSRAIVSIAVTGKAGPAKEGTTTDDVFNTVGAVHIGVAIRTSGAAEHQIPSSIRNMFNVSRIKYTTGNATIFCVSQFIDINQEKDHPATALIKKYRKDHRENGGNCPPTKECASLAIVSPLRDIIRWYTIFKACEFATAAMNKLGKVAFVDKNGPVKCLGTEPYDGQFKQFDEPAWIINERKN